jgi:hypothetical protein
LPNNRIQLIAVPFCSNKTILYLRKPILVSLVLHQAALMNRPDGGIGRRAGLKNQWDFSLAGSIPAPGTEKPLISSKIKGFDF